MTLITTILLATLTADPEGVVPADALPTSPALVAAPIAAGRSDAPSATKLASAREVRAAQVTGFSLVVAGSAFSAVAMTAGLVSTWDSFFRGPGSVAILFIVPAFIGLAPVLFVGSLVPVLGPLLTGYLYSQFSYPTSPMPLIIGGITAGVQLAGLVVLGIDALSARAEAKKKHEGFAVTDISMTPIAGGAAMGLSGTF